MAKENIAIWHPMVYEREARKQALVGIRSFHARPGRKIPREAMEKRLEFNLYHVLGELDLMIRANVLRDNVMEFEKEIDGIIAVGMDRRASFEIQESYRSWGFDVKLADPEGLSGFSPEDLQKVILGEAKADDDVIKNLVEKNLLLFYGPIPKKMEKEDLIKSFVFIRLETPYYGVSDLREVVKTVLKMEPEERIVVGAHIGVGIGFAGNILLELNSNDPGVVWPFVKKIMGNGHYIEVKTESFLVGEILREKVEEYSAYEFRDDSSAGWNRQFPALRMLSAGDKEKAVFLCKKFREQSSDPRTAEYFDRLINSVISKKHAGYHELINKLHFFFESQLRESLILHAKDKWKGNWKTSQRELGLASPLWMGSLLQLSDSVLLWNKKFGQMVDNKSIESIRQFAKLRNELVHKYKESGYDSIDLLEKDLIRIFEDNLWQAIIDVCKAVLRTKQVESR